MTVIEAAVLQVDSNDLSLRSVSSIEDAAAPPQPTPAPLKYVCLSRDNTFFFFKHCLHALCGLFTDASKHIHFYFFRPLE